jgi:hypothetical protein
VLHLRFQRDFPSSAAVLWPYLVEPARMARWSPARLRIVAVGDGGPGSVGEVREVMLPIPSGTVCVEQRIVESEPPRRLAWRVVSGMPLHDHLAVLSLDERAGGTRLTWVATYDFATRWLAKGSHAYLTALHVRALDELLRTMRDRVETPTSTSGAP